MSFWLPWPIQAYWGSRFSIILVYSVYRITQPRKLRFFLWGPPLPNDLQLLPSHQNDQRLFSKDQNLEGRRRKCLYAVMLDINDKIWLHRSPLLGESVNEPRLSETEPRCQSCVSLSLVKVEIFPSQPSWNEQRRCYARKYVNKPAKYCVLELAKGQVALFHIVCVLGEPAPTCRKRYKAASVLYRLEATKAMLWCSLHLSTLTKDCSRDPIGQGNWDCI